MSDMTLKAILLGEDKSMSKSFKGAGKAAQTSAKDVEKASKGIKGHVSGLSSALRGDFTQLTGSIAGGLSMLGPVGMAAGAAVAGVGVGLGALAKGASESIDAFKNVAGETLKMQRIMGGSAEDVSRLRFEFQQTGVDSDTASKAIGLFSKGLVGFNGKTGASIPILKSFGINAKDAHGKLRPMADLLPDLAAKFAKMPNGAEKSALALKLFGKGGLALLPFLNRGKEGLDKLRAASDRFGLTLSGKDLDALKKSRVAHKEWDAAMEGAKVRIGAQLLPMVTKLVMYFTTRLIPIIVAAGLWVQKHGAQIQATAATIGRAIVTMVKVWVAWETVVFTVVAAVARVVWWLWNNALKPATTFILIAFAALASTIGHVLQALGHVPGFKWAKTAGDMMVGAAKAAERLAVAINTIPPNKTVTINTFYKTHGAPAPLTGSGAGVKGYASGGTNIPRGWATVGEHGPELLFMRGGETVVGAGDTARLLASGGGGGHQVVEHEHVLVVKNPDGQTIERILLDRKRRTRQPLAFV